MSAGDRSTPPSGEPAAMTAHVAGAGQVGGEPLIRPLLTSDLPAVMAMEERSHPEPWTEGIMRDCLRAGYIARVLEAPDGTLIGYGLLSAAAGESHLLNLTTHPNHRGQGYGRMLLRALLAEARLAGAELTILEVRPSNLSALALYRSEGFEQVGIRRDYYPDFGGAREDAWVFKYLF